MSDQSPEDRAVTLLCRLIPGATGPKARELVRALVEVAREGIEVGRCGMIELSVPLKQCTLLPGHSSPCSFKEDPDEA